MPERSLAIPWRKSISTKEPVRHRGLCASSRDFTGLHCSLEKPRRSNSRLARMNCNSGAHKPRLGVSSRALSMFGPAKTQPLVCTPTSRLSNKEFDVPLIEASLPLFCEDFFGTHRMHANVAVD